MARDLRIRRDGGNRISQPDDLWIREFIRQQVREMAAKEQKDAALRDVFGPFPLDDPHSGGPFDEEEDEDPLLVALLTLIAWEEDECNSEEAEGACPLTN